MHMTGLVGHMVSNGQTRYHALQLTKGETRPQNGPVEADMKETNCRRPRADSAPQPQDRNMLWRRGTLVRLLKKLCFTVFWGISFLLFYLSMTNVRLVQLQTVSTDSPALLAETIIKSCLGYQDKSLTTYLTTAPTIAVLGRRSPKVAELVTNLLTPDTDHQVLLVSDAAVLQNLRQLQPADAAVENLKVTFVGIQNTCNQGLLEEVFKSRHVEKLHILLDEFDFSPVDFHQDVSVTFRCLVHMLETVAKRQDTQIYIHTSRYRHVPRYILNMAYSAVTLPGVQGQTQGQSAKVRLEHSGQDSAVLLPSNFPTKESRVSYNHRINSCDPLYDYDFYHDVFMKSVSIYITTYKNLYSLNVQYIVS